jgi:hypothetical protein
MHIRHPEWRDSHEPTKYPFGQDCTLVNEAGDVIFETTFLDATFYVIGAQAGLYLSRISVDVDNVTIWVGDPTVAQLAYGTFTRAEPPDELRFVDNYGRPAGLLVSESIRMALFSSWPAGDHDFLPTQTQFVARCCHALPMVGVRGFELDDGSILTGDVWLVGDDGVVLSCDSVDEAGACGEDVTSTTAVRVDIVGDSLFRRKLCSTPDFFETPHYLQTVTFCAPGLLDSYSSYVSSETVLSSSSSLCSFEPSEEPPENPPILDLLLMIDSTASMAPYMERLTQDYLGYLIEQFNLDTSGLLDERSVKVGIIQYKDYTDGTPYDTDGWDVVLPFTDIHDEATIISALTGITCSGGGDFNQAQLKVLRDIGPEWTTAPLNGRSDAGRMIVCCIGNSGHLNAPVHFGTLFLPYASWYPFGSVYEDLTQIRNSLNTHEISVIPVVVRYPDSPIPFPDPILLAMPDEVHACSQILRIGQPFPETLTDECHGFSDAARDRLYTRLYGWIAHTGAGTPCEDVFTVTPIERKTTVITHYPATETGCVRCGPGEFGDVKIFVHSQSASDTVLRIRPVSEGLKIETVGEAIESK